MKLIKFTSVAEDQDGGRLFWINLDKVALVDTDCCRVEGAGTRIVLGDTTNCLEVWVKEDIHTVIRMLTDA